MFGLAQLEDLYLDDEDVEVTWLTQHLPTSPSI